jgi:hypothetical protein
MRVKLTHEHKWVIETKEQEDFILQIVTPNNHKFVKFVLDDSDVNVASIDEVVKDCKFSESEISALTNICPFYERIFCKLSLSHFWCLVKQTFLPIPHYANSYDKIYYVVSKVHCTLLEYVLEYDRKCENTKALQLIGQTCSRVGGMADLLEFTRGVVNIVKDDKKQDK